MPGPNGKGPADVEVQYPLNSNAHFRRFDISHLVPEIWLRDLRRLKQSLEGKGEILLVNLPVMEGRRCLDLLALELGRKKLDGTPYQVTLLGHPLNWTARAVPEFCVQREGETTYKTVLGHELYDEGEPWGARDLGLDTSD